MVKREGHLHEEENLTASSLSPFRSYLYSTLWIAALFLYMGAAMYDIGASWLMTSLAPNPLFVSHHNSYYSTNFSLCITIWDII
jgi:Transmembrane secretion effector